MERKINYKIEEDAHGQIIGDFLRQRQYGTAMCRVLKQSEMGIMKNGMRAGVREKLCVGDMLEICLKEEETSHNIVPVQKDFEVLYEDEDILVINKPYDTPIHPSVNNYDNTLANGVMYYYKRQNCHHVFRCINRLDRDTTGVTIIAKHALSASILSNAVKERRLSRVYLALVEGKTDEKGTIDLPIGRMEDTIIKRCIDYKEGKRAVTHYHRVALLNIEGKEVSAVALKLETGRTHQIRVHMAAIGHPLIGDFLYNETNRMLTRQALHGMECGFKHPITGKYQLITAPLPNDMKEVIGQVDANTFSNLMQYFKA